MNIENDTCYLNLKSEMSLVLTQDIIDHIKSDVTGLICTRMENVRGIILYGSCARGDFTDESDVDIAILTESDRETVKKYDSMIDDIATSIGIDTMAVVNFVCLPQKEFEEKSSWYPYFMNIKKEGIVLYEQ